ncbi:MAG: hypothetical protein R2764_04840 [Bacteroidales bacterium]
MVNKLKIAILFLAFGMASLVFAQETSLTEEDIVSKAQELFSNQDYQKAMPLFAQLVSIHPENPDYNYKFGVCTLLGDREDKNRSVRYLKIASETIGISENLEVYYYLGLAHHQNLEFTEAMKNYNLFLASLSPESSRRAEVLEKVNACLNGLTLGGNEKEIVARSEFQKDNFHRGYRADNFDGILILKPDQLVSNKEKSQRENSFVYISEPRDIIYFSGYENEESQNRDIFKVHLSQNGEWGEVEKLPSVINTLYDEDYPVLANNGTTLFFCSKGHNSLGGYDVFRSQLDTSKNVFTQPENLGIGVNSPFNDILYIEDREKEYAYFSSDRDYLNNAIGVFKIRLEQKPVLSEQILAETAIDETIFQEVEDEAKLSATDGEAEIQLVANKVPNSDASRHAAAIISEKTQLNKLADSAFMMVAATKKFVREITNRRDRANSISQKKAEEAKSLEIEFDDMISKFSLVESTEGFDKLLAEAVALKTEICQAYERSNRAKLIAWEYGRQIKTKNAELIELKKKAGEIQALSIGGEAEDVLTGYLEMTNNFAIADSLFDYTVEILAISQNTISYDIPEKELAFADQLKIEYQQKTMLANGDCNRPEFNSDIPVVVIDNRVAQNVDAIAVAMNPVKIAEHIAYNEPAFENSDLDNEQIEINFEIDKPILKAIPVNVEPIEISKLMAEAVIPEEEIEINLESESIKSVPIAVPFDLSLIVQNKLIIEDELEINFKVDETANVHISEVIMPIYLEEMASIWMEEDEVLEIRNTEYSLIPVDLVEPILFNEIAYSLDDAEEILEIGSFEEDAIEYTIPSQINPIVLDEPLLVELAFDANEVEINFNPDKEFPINVPEIIDPIGITDLAYNGIDPDETSLEISLDTDKSTEKLEVEKSNSSNSMFYLRELASNVMTIESSRSDEEILQLALTDYDELSYEELLFAASLATSPQEKLMIFNVAFVHIDRDWRAFNNAAVTALQIKDLDQAECLLHQASLISENNGKVYNNMGVLFCYRNEFEKAEEFFLSATSSGVDSGYNLQVVNSIREENRNTQNGIIPGVSVMNTESLSDIIDYGGSAE